MLSSAYSNNRQESAKAHYDLYGVSNHSGTLHGGHYTAYCRHPTRQQNWHLYNDRAVSGTSKGNVISYEAYLLFFERQDKEPVSDCLSTKTGLESEESEEEEGGDEEW